MYNGDKKQQPNTAAAKRHNMTGAKTKVCDGHIFIYCLIYFPLYFLFLGRRVGIGGPIGVLVER